MPDALLPGIVAVTSVLALATGFGLWWRRRDGVLRPVAPPPAGSADLPNPQTTADQRMTADQRAAADRRTTADQPAAADRRAAAQRGKPGVLVSPGLLVALGGEPGVPVTLLQFSSAFCAPCRATRRVLAEVARTLSGVRHVEVDAASHPAGVSALSIWRTPTVLVVDAAGRVLHRGSGVPVKAEVIAVVAPLLARSTS